MRLFRVLAAIIAAFATAIAYIRSSVHHYAAGLSDALIRGKKHYLQQLRQRRPASVPPHVLLILYDDLGLGDHTSTAIQTPHLDALAARSTSSNAFYAGASLCTPSRATLLTGRLAPRTGLGSVVLFPVGSAVDRVFQLLGLSRGQGVLCERMRVMMRRGVV